jgi:hypothetical protein
MNEKRTRLALEEFPKDPVLCHPIPINDMGELLGSSWGAASMWGLMDWVQRSDAVRQRTRELAAQSDSSRIRSAAALMVGLLDKTLQPASANPSYEEGEGVKTAGWWYWVASTGKMERQEGVAHTGKASIHCVGMKRGGPVHELKPFPPGRYAAMCYAYVPEGKPAKGTVELVLTPRGADDQNLPGLATKVTPVPGQWTLVAAAGEIAAKINDKGVVKALLIPIVDGFDDGEVYLDDCAVYRLGDLNP